MTTPEFLALEKVLELHAELIERYGGSSGVRDMGRLHSALASPQAGMGGTYFHATIFEMAAAYLFHIVKNRPFVDGNKRTGAVAALQFLWLNGVTCTASGARYETLIMRIAESKAHKSAAAAFFSRHAKATG
jgi:death-on-curing protein